MVGGSNAILDFGVFDLLLLVAPTRNPDTLVAYNTLAVICAIVNSYLWNRAWTFRAERNHGRRALWRERSLFVAQGVLNVVVNDLVLAGVTVVLNRNHLLSTYAANNLAKFVAVMVASSVSFLVMRYVIFKGRRSAPRGPGTAGADDVGVGAWRGRLGGIDGGSTPRQ